ncbi:MAG: DUF1292 domain-containing protein [Bacillota bacterium]
MTTTSEDVITLIDEEGEEHEFTVLDILEVDGTEYAILVPVDDEEQEDEVVIFKFTEDDEGNEILVEIEDDEWEKVADAWQEKVGTEH